MGNFSKMLNFEGMKCVFKKVIKKIFTVILGRYMKPRDYKYHFAQFMYNRGGDRTWTENFQ